MASRYTYCIYKFTHIFGYMYIDNYIVYLCIYIYLYCLYKSSAIYTWNPNDTCFEWSLGLLLESSNPTIEDKQVPGIYIYTLYIFILFDICDLYISQEPDLLFGFPYLYKPTFALLTTYFAALFYCVLFNNRNPYEKKNKKLPIKPTKP